MRHGENPQFMESFLFHRVNPGKNIRQLFIFISYSSEESNPLMYLAREVQFLNYIPCDLKGK